MTSITEIPSLASLEYVPYIDETGNLPDNLQGKIGVYAIFDNDKVLQLVAYSRDVYLSLKQHLVRQTQKCYWVKYQTIERPNRTILESIQNSWIEENGAIPVGNETAQVEWNDPIDTKSAMTNEDRENFAKQDESGQAKLLKKVAKRVEETILSDLKTRGVQTEIRFNPKLKESGLLDLK